MTIMLRQFLFLKIIVFPWKKGFNSSIFLPRSNSSSKHELPLWVRHIVNTKNQPQYRHHRHRHLLYQQQPHNSLSALTTLFSNHPLRYRHNLRIAIALQPHQRRWRHANMPQVHPETIEETSKLPLHQTRSIYNFYESDENLNLHPDFFKEKLYIDKHTLLDIHITFKDHTQDVIFPSLRYFFLWFITPLVQYIV